MSDDEPRFHAESNEQYFCIINPKEFEVSLRFIDNGVLRIVAKRVGETPEMRRENDTPPDVALPNQRVACRCRTSSGNVTGFTSAKLSSLFSKQYRRTVLKRIFALRGKSNLGKSQSIRTVVELLTGKHPNLKMEHDHVTRVDVRVVLTINGWKIGIESQGAPNSRLIKESLDLFVRVGCDVIVCATRTSGGTVDAVNSLEGYEVHWLEQREHSKPIEQILRNLAVARKIVEQIETLIGSPKPAPARSLAATA